MDETQFPFYKLGQKEQRARVVEDINVSTKHLLIFPLVRKERKILFYAYKYHQWQEKFSFLDKTLRNGPIREHKKFLCKKKRLEIGGNLCKHVSI